jgi:late competence protein required for DNA uptake (superfamily II DNA/RNA helicase)
MYYINGQSDEKLIYNFNRIKRAIIITDEYKDKFSGFDDTDIIIYFADNATFDYKKLIFFCGKAGRSDKIKSSEVIFLANQETWNMEKAKSIIRNFNKEAWEKGLLNI